MTTKAEYYRGVTGEIPVAVREARLVVERFLSVIGVPMGAVAPIRDVVIDAESLGLGALEHLAGGFDEMVDFRPVRWSVADDHVIAVDADGMSALLVSPDLIDLAVARAHRDRAATVHVRGLAEPRFLAALTASASLYDVDLSVHLPTGEEWIGRGHLLEPEARRSPADGPQLEPDAARIECAISANAEAGAGEVLIHSAAALRTLREDFRVDAELWWSLWDRANQALAPDSVLSRSHAGASVYDDSGQLLGELGEEWDDGYLDESASAAGESSQRSTIQSDRSG